MAEPQSGQEPGTQNQPAAEPGQGQGTPPVAAPASEPKKRVPFEELPPWAQKQLKDYQSLKDEQERLKAEREEAEKKAKIAKLEDEKRYEEAIAQREADFQAELKKRDMANAKDKLLAKLQIAGYSEGQAELYTKGYDGGEADGTPDEYLAKILEKSPLPEPVDPKKPGAPVRTSTGPVNGKLTSEQLLALENDPDPKKRQEAISYKEKLIIDNYNKTGKWELPS